MTIFFRTFSSCKAENSDTWNTNHADSRHYARGGRGDQAEQPRGRGGASQHQQDHRAPGLQQ